MRVARKAFSVKCSAYGFGVCACDSRKLKLAANGPGVLGGGVAVVALAWQNELRQLVPVVCRNVSSTGFINVSRFGVPFGSGVVCGAGGSGCDDFGHSVSSIAYQTNAEVAGC